MADERLEDHLRNPAGRGHRPDGAYDGYAGGAACGDLVRFSVALSADGHVEAGFDAEGCGAVTAAASAAVTLSDGASLLDAARIDTGAIAAELGGLIAGKMHAAELVADAFHRALGSAAAATASLRSDPRRVLVAMSGGVDSSVAALLSGPGAVAVTLELWRDPENDGQRSCCSASAVRGARALAHRLGLPHLTLDLRERFRDEVVEPWLADHRAGRTPNPCVRCNGSVRLDAMVDLAVRLGAGSLVTGHYARTTPDGLIRRGRDEAKDQSYMLAGLKPATIARLSFPLGEMTKPQVRAIAAEHGLEVADAPESQDLCFLAGTGRQRFLERHGGMRERRGTLIDEEGRVVGEHGGHFNYTVGQRRGIGLHGAEPLYVLATDAQANTVTVGPREALATTRVALTDVRVHVDSDRVDRVRLRYHAPAVPCRLEGTAALLERPFAAAAPGQTAVLLEGDVVVGSATIAR